MKTYAWSATGMRESSDAPTLWIRADDTLREKREGWVMVPRKLLVRIWGFLAQDCTPCAAEDCQIGGKNTGVDQLVDEIKPLLVAAPREEGK